MIKFSKEKVLLLHQLIAEETGGSIGVRDEGLLESALEAAFSTFGGQELYPTKEEKGARIGFNLISNRAFVDGNKRIGMHIMLTFLLVNGIRLNCTNEDVVEAGRVWHPAPWAMKNCCGGSESTEKVKAKHPYRTHRLVSDRFCVLFFFVWGLYGHLPVLK